MPHLHLPIEHTDADLVLAGEARRDRRQRGLYVDLDPRRRRRRAPRSRPWCARAPPSRAEPVRRARRRRWRALASAAPCGAPPPAPRPATSARSDAPQVGRRRAATGLDALQPASGRAAAASAAAGGSAAASSARPRAAWRPRAPTARRTRRATCPPRVCISASLARNERPERPLKPVTACSVRPVRDQLAGDRGGQRLAGLGLPDHEPAARVLARPAREALAVLDDVAARRPGTGPRLARGIRTSLSLASSSSTVSPRELRDVAHEALARLLAVLDPRQPLLPVAGQRRRGERVLAEQADDVEALLGAHQRAAVALDVADVDQALDDRRARGRRADARSPSSPRAARRRRRACRRSPSRPAATRRSSAAAAWSPSPPTPTSRVSTSSPCSSLGSCCVARPRRRRRPRRCRRRLLAVDAAPARHDAAPGRACGRRARRPSSPAACSRTPPRDGRRPGSAARPCRRRGGRRRSSCRALCSERVGMIAWWSVTLASLITRPSGSTSRPVTYSAAFAYSRCSPTSSAIGLISPTMSRRQEARVRARVGERLVLLVAAAARRPACAGRRSRSACWRRAAAT